MESNPTEEKIRMTVSAARDVSKLALTYLALWFKDGQVKEIHLSGLVLGLLHQNLTSSSSSWLERTETVGMGGADFSDAGTTETAKVSVYIRIPTLLVRGLSMFGTTLILYYPFTVPR